MAASSYLLRHGDSSAHRQWLDLLGWIGPPKEVVEDEIDVRQLYCLEKTVNSKQVEEEDPCKQMKKKGSDPYKYVCTSSFYNNDDMTK